jgi:hypothetical protein
LGVIAKTSVVADLVNAKIVAYKTQQGMSNYFNDEFLATPNVDPTNSTRYAVGPNKRTKILPGGMIVTNVMVSGPAAGFLYAHWYGFLLFSQPGSLNVAPPPSDLLYNYDPTIPGFTEFDPTIFTVEVRDSSNSTTLLTLTPDMKTSFALGAGTSFRLRFTNTDVSRIFYLSDWIFLYQ